MKKRNLLLVVLLLVVVAVASTATFAWLTDTNRDGENNKIEYTVGSVDYTIIAENTNTNLLVPGDTFGTVTITNNSTVATNIRVLITVTVKNTSSTQMTIGTQGTHIILKDQASDWKYEKATDDSQSYYYFGGVGSVKSADKEDIAANVEENGTSLPALFDSLELNGELVGNDYAGAEITITFTFQAKQADHVEWKDMGNIDFTTGVAKVNAGQ